jgi:hypothetical protein
MCIDIGYVPGYVEQIMNERRLGALRSILVTHVDCVLPHDVYDRSWQRTEISRFLLAITLFVPCHMY